MNSSTRTQVLSIFKTLHRARQHVFRGDEEGQKFIRLKINEEFRKWQSVQDPEEITKLIGIAEESNEILRTKIIQAQEVRPNVYRLRSDQLQANCTDIQQICDDCTCGRKISIGKVWSGYPSST